MVSVSASVADAIRYAEDKHYWQKYGALSYMQGHLIPVMNLVRVSGFASGTMLKAAILHDVVEDTDATIDNINLLFGSDVGSLVDRLTHRSGVKYNEYIDNILDSHEASVIKACDSMVNLSTTVREFDRSQRMVNRITMYSTVISRVNATYDFTF